MRSGNEGRFFLGEEKMKPVVLAFAFCLLAVGVDARMPAGGPTPDAAWFRSLKQPNGGSCCDLSDCFRLEDNLVRQVKIGMAEPHWQFKAASQVFKGLGDNQWHDIPMEVVIRGRKLAELGGNVTGQWIVCAMHGGYMSQGGILVLCAVPPGAV